MYFYFHTSCTTWTQVVLVHSHVFLLPHLVHYLDTSGTNPLNMYFYFHTSCTTWTQVVLVHSTCTYFYFHASCTTWTQVVLVHSHVFLLPHFGHYSDPSGTNPLACISTSNFGHYSDTSGASPLTCISTSTPRALLGHKWC